MNGLSPWAVSAYSQLGNCQTPLLSKATGSLKINYYLTQDSLWICTEQKGRQRIAIRAAFSPGGSLMLKQIKKSTESTIFILESDSGSFKITSTLTGTPDLPIIRYTTALKPVAALTFPFWLRDLLIGSSPKIAKGIIHAAQEGTRTGFTYFSTGKSTGSSVFYLQNLTALADYCAQTQTSAGNTVGGQWPELGFALPVSNDKTINANKETILSDAIIILENEVPKNEPEMVRQYFRMLGAAYMCIPKPQTNYQQWPDILDKGLVDLRDNPGCWAQVAGQKYFNAYVSDYETPPEIMVQLAVLLPLQDYTEWSGEQLDMMDAILKSLPAFYDEKLGTIMRWLPAVEDKLKGDEEQKVPKVMDSWYLHHPLLNLSRMALKGDKQAKELFLNSIDYCIKVAHTFKYKWPVFYKMDTLEIIKAETAPGKGGQKDVTGLYTHVMLQAYELTNEKRFLTEAETAAKTLEGYGFEIFYQANNTAFSAGALLRLHKLTGNGLYLELSYLCLAAIFRNTQLWDCNYGYGKNYPTFFALFPLSNAPYTAVYEEQEVFCAFHDYLKHAEGLTILPEIRLLMAEYIRYLVDRAVYYYPTMLPKEMLEEKPKVGELVPDLWIALEDLHDGWEKSGSVGQEVYGAGNAFGILPRHYFRIPKKDFMLYTDYPVAAFKVKGSKASFRILGDKRLSCRLALVKHKAKKLPEMKLTANGNISLTGKPLKSGNMEYQVNGDTTIEITWKA